MQALLAETDNPTRSLSFELDHHAAVGNRGSPGAVRVDPQERADRQGVHGRKSRSRARRSKPGTESVAVARKMPEPAESKELKVAANHAEPMPVNTLAAADLEATTAPDNLPADAPMSDQSTDGLAPRDASAAGTTAVPISPRPPSPWWRLESPPTRHDRTVSGERRS